MVFTAFTLQSNKHADGKVFLYWCLPQQAELFTLQTGAIIWVSYLLAGSLSLDWTQDSIQAVKISREGGLLEKPECVNFLIGGNLR